MKKKDTEIRSVCGRMCEIKNYLKVLAENLKRRDHFEVVSAHRVKPAYNRIARGRKIFSIAGRFRLTRVLVIWFLGIPDPWKCELFTVKDRFPLCPGSVNTGFAVE
jgi:hypothetical protein